MSKIKIYSNPYKKEIEYFTFNESIGEWNNIKESTPSSHLLELDTEKSFLPFLVNEIIETIRQEYYVGELVTIYFEGTEEEYEELESVCNKKKYKDILELHKSDSFLENGRDILNYIKDNFNNVKPIIDKFIDDETEKKKLGKVSDALDDIIPICVFGNYSSGKSSFINSLIGHEILASGGTVVTAKVYRIKQSSYEDRAKIQFTFQGNDVILSFEDTNFRVLKGENVLIDSIKEAIESVEEKNMYSLLKVTLEKINSYEKNKQENYDISNIISLEIPFSKNGIIGYSKNKFVIFDTPGSNSNSHIEHAKVLEKALEGFSNGIPVWVSTYDNLDSTDNAELCEKILKIPALDKRFTMIVCNKSDMADLEGENLSDSHIQEIKEYESVEKMYSSGIYFVSSIMGLAAKTDGKLIEGYCRKVYHQQRSSYEDPEDEYYLSLYKFNIMPEQMKKEIIEESICSKNLLYANSGLQCIESEMEIFASHYAAYNKCQMVFLFLNEVVDEVNRKINQKTEVITKSKEERTERLEDEKTKLIEEIADTSSKILSRFEKEAKEYSSDISEETNEYEHSLEEIEKLTEELWKNKADDMDRNEHAEALKSGKERIWNKVRNYAPNVKDAFFKSGFNVERGLEKGAQLFDELKSTVKDVQDKQQQVKDVDTEIDKITADEVMNHVTEDYKINLSNAYEIIDNQLKNYWLQDANKLRDEIIKIIKDTDRLTNEQREEMQDIIMSYEALKFDDEAEKIFIKPKFLQGHFFGVQLFESEKLNNKKLTDIYNKKIRENVKEISKTINENCLISFKSWKENLNILIEQNITDYNPTLKDLSEMIKKDAQDIAELEKDQMTIKQSLETIESLMSTKTSE